MKPLPRNLLLDFPAFLTRKGAVDLIFVDLMRPLVSYGIRPGQFAAIVGELQKKRYHGQFLQHEHKLNGTVKGMGNKKQFSQFCPKGAILGKFLVLVILTL
jgi:hypothetical protein